MPSQMRARTHIIVIVDHVMSCNMTHISCKFSLSPAKHSRNNLGIDLGLLQVAETCGSRNNSESYNLSAITYIHINRI